MKVPGMTRRKCGIFGIFNDLPSWEEEQVWLPRVRFIEHSMEREGLRWYQPGRGWVPRGSGNLDWKADG